MIIGGGQVYQNFIDQADILYITHVHQKPVGDIVFKNKLGRMENDL